MSTAALSHDIKAAPPVRSGLKPLPVNRPGDVYEEEAERVSRQVVDGHMRTRRVWGLSQITADSFLQRECACGDTCDDCKKNKKQPDKKQPDEMLQREATGTASFATAPAKVQSVLRGAGRPLDRATRSFMEGRFGYNFEGVRVFHDEAAARSAQAVAANAYTVGEKIVFDQGRYAPGSETGRRLLAHELTHVVQQSRGGLSPAATGDPALEADARSSAHSLDSGSGMVRVSTASGVGMARDATAAAQIMIEVKFPDGVQRLTQEQFASYKQNTLRSLRNKLLGVQGAADYGRKVQVDTLAEYQGGVETLWDAIKKPKSLIGIAADIKAGVTPPYLGMWGNSKGAISQGLAACDRGDLASAAQSLAQADRQYRDDLATWNAYIRATIGGAELVAQNLETVRDVSFAIALVAGAAIAAPLIAGAVATAGVTGTAATVLTAGGTALVTGTGGAVLRGGAVVGASKIVDGKVDTKAAWEETKKGLKEGAVTGLTAGLGTSLQGVAKGVKLAEPLVQAAAKRCVVDAGVNVAGAVTTELLDKVAPPEPAPGAEVGAPAGPEPVLGPKSRAALTGCLSGILGVPAAKLGKVGSKVADAGVNTGVGFVDAKLQGKNNEDAVLAGAQGGVTALIVAKGHTGSEQAKLAQESPTVNAGHGTESTQVAGPAAHTADPAAQGPEPAPVVAPAVAGPVSAAHIGEPAVPVVESAVHVAELPAKVADLPAKIADPAAHVTEPATLESGPGKAARQDAEALPAEKAREKVTDELQAKQKTGPEQEVAPPAINKDEAKAKAAVGDGHEAVVTEQGIGRCSPTPCPVLHVEYAKELEGNPKLQAIYESVQAQRKTNPEAAADKAAALIRTLEAVRGNAMPAAPEGAAANAGPDRSSMTKEQWKKQEGQRRWGNAVDEWAANLDLDQHGETPLVKGTEASGYSIDGKRVPIKKQSRLDMAAVPGKGDVAVPLLPGETHKDAVDRVKTVIGTKISDVPELNAAWEDAKQSVLSRNTLTSKNYGNLYDATRNAFWRRVAGDPKALKILNDAGFGFTGGKGSAPRLLGTGKDLKSAETKVSLDHIEEKAQGNNWTKALDADNLNMEFAMPNSYREIIQARHPELRN